MSDEAPKLPELDHVPRLVTETPDNPVVRKTDLDDALYPVRRWLWVATGIGILNVLPNADRAAQSVTSTPVGFESPLQILMALIALL